jgi:anti-anti-sigma factor
MKQIFSCTMTLDNNHVMVYLDGELDASTAECLFTRLAPLVAKARNVEVHLAGLSFLGVTGLLVLANLQHCADTKGGKLRLTEPNSLVRHVVAVTGLGDRVTIDEPASNIPVGRQ